MEDHHDKNFVTRGKLFARKAKLYFLQNKLDLSIEFYDKSLLEDSITAVKDELKKV